MTNKRRAERRALVVPAQSHVEDERGKTARQRHHARRSDLGIFIDSPKALDPALPPRALPD